MFVKPEDEAAPEPPLKSCVRSRTRFQDSLPAKTPAEFTRSGSLSLYITGKSLG